ncbi:hypothetical protein AVEN_197026-1 [Araneus ventricosus]|uniref:STPR domain-containing protein n=1 Tax=Araneus ventricosus TaxID=182803 RepID=A0A4Y2GFG1_ARAVE|nr:hypothetical protein AVEN_197026-1 [Araneus ventricosus]
MAQRGQKKRAEETEEQRNKGLSHMAQRGLERKTEETEEQRNSRLSDMAQRIQGRRAEEIRRTKEWSIDDLPFLPDSVVFPLLIKCTLFTAAPWIKLQDWIFGTYIIFFEIYVRDTRDG